MVYHVIPYTYLYIYISIRTDGCIDSIDFPWYTWAYRIVFVVHFCVSKRIIWGVYLFQLSKIDLKTRFFLWIGHVEMNFVRRIVCSMPGSTEISYFLIIWLVQWTFQTNGIQVLSIFTWLISFNAFFSLLQVRDTRKSRIPSLPKPRWT